MNFLKEINAFEDWLETNPIPDTAQLMWYKLMSINNKCGWIEWFDLANTTLMAKMNVSSEKTLIAARNILIDKCRIKYRASGNRKKAGKYSILIFDTPISAVKNTVERKAIKEVENAVDREVESAALNKLNETKLNNNIYSSIISFLNEKAGTSYKASSSKTQSLINARLNEKFTIDDFKKVIENKTAEWKGTEMEKYLRPETLFGPKFEGYLNQKLVPRLVKNGYQQKDMDNKSNFEGRQHKEEYFENFFDNTR